jgi:DNA repair protein RadC
LALKIKDLPEVERPYEKLELYGEKSLSNAELLAIIIKSGTKEYTSVDIANQILKLNKNEDKGDLNFLRDLSLEELKNLKGIGRVKAIQIKAICELSTRMNKPTNYRKIQIKRPSDVANLFMDDLRFEKKELVKAIILNSKNVILKILDVSIGSSNFSNINIKYILSEAIKMNAPKIILIHNHPSGDPTPSKKDFEVTDRLKKAAELLTIELLDHIIIGNMNYESIIQNQTRQNNS